MIFVVIIRSKKIMLFQKYVIFYPLVFITKLTPEYLYFKNSENYTILESSITLIIGIYFTA